MARIFISYSREDQNIATWLARGFEGFEHSVFFAGGSIAPGEKFQETISLELKKADVVVFVLSQNSASSKWVMTEMGIALGYWEERGKPLIIPIVIDDITIPAQLLRIQSIKARRDSLDEAIIDTLAAIDKWIGRSQAKEDDIVEVQDRIEQNAATYINESIDRLQAQETRYRNMSYRWYTLAFVSLLGGVVYGVFRTATFKAIETNWIVALQFFMVSLIIVGLLIALSRFSFILGRSFMVESLRNSDRIHAISFGRFYLKAFGSKADWQEVKEVFQHWNIDKGSDFINQNPKDFDPEVFKLVTELAGKLGGRVKQ